jgi:lipopolysaccharide transport protein LptA
MRYGLRTAGCRSAVLLFGWIGCVCAQEPGMEISGFRVPEYNAQGEMTSQLFGDRAEMLSGGEIKVSVLRVEFYQDDALFMEVSSPYCFYRRADKQARSDAPVFAKTDEIQLQGKGFLLEAADRTVHVLDETRVTIRKGMLPNHDGTEPDEADEMVITSVELFLDHTERSARFERNVEVRDPQMELDSDTLTVFLDEADEVRSIEAKGGVEMRHDRLSGSAGAFSAAGKGADDIETGKTNRMVITSDAFVLDQQQRTALFTGQVKVRDPQLTMDCDALTVHYREENEINWIEASGNVTMLFEGRKALSGKAVYSVETGEMILTEDPKILEERNMICAETIRFRREGGEAVFEPAARLVFYPDGERKMDLFGK